MGFRRWLWIFFCVTSCVAVQHRQPHQDAGNVQTPPPLDPVAIADAYAAALNDSKRPSEENISNDLLAVTGDTVTVATWTKAKYYLDDKGEPIYQPGDQFTLHGLTWFTVVPEMQAFCSNYQGDYLLLRIAQNLGMPPCIGSGVPEAPGMYPCNDVFVELEINTRCLVRPCPDPEITDTSCSVLAPKYNEDARQPPPFCSLLNAPVVGCATPDNLHAWMCSHWTESFVQPRLYEQYPWTALGYTYDWGSTDHVGQSEFIAFPKTEVTFKAMYPVNEYCGRN